MSNVVVLQMSEPEYEFLVHIFTAYVGGGLPPEALADAALLYRRIQSRQVIAPSDPETREAVHLGSAKAEITPTGVALEIDPSASGETSI